MSRAYNFTPSYRIDYGNTRVSLIRVNGDEGLLDNVIESYLRNKGLEADPTCKLTDRQIFHKYNYMGIEHV